MPDSGAPLAQPGTGRYPDNIPRPDPSTLTTEQLLREINHLQQLHEEKILGTNARIDSLKELMEAQFEASTKNVTTAFLAAKEAVGKQETDTSKRLEGLQAMLQTTEASLSRRFEDPKERMDRGEGKGAGLSSAAGAMLAVAAVLVAIVTAFLNK